MELSTKKMEVTPKDIGVRSQEIEVSFEASSSDLHYLPAVLAAIKYIESHLAEEISMQDVAAHVSFSQYHFHRIFLAMLGESIAEYVRKRRLTMAAERLTSSDTPILELSMQSGFDSQETFTRAFKKLFRTTPGAYRKSGASIPAIRKFEATEEWVRHRRSGIKMNHKLVQRGRELAIGMAGSFQPGDTEAIGALWQRFVPRIDEISHQKPYSLGVCMSSHPDVEKKPGTSFVYVAAWAVDSIENVPEGMVVCDIPASTYALFTHSGPIANIKHTVEYIWGTWVPKSGYELNDSPDFELYDDRFDPCTGKEEVDIYVPVKVPVIV